MKKEKNTRYDTWIKKSYNNYKFLNSPDARAIRVLSEMIEPKARFKKQNIHNTIVFFGSARILSKREALDNLNHLKTKTSKTKEPSKNILLKIEHAKREVFMSKYYEQASQLSERLTSWFKNSSNNFKNFVVCSGGGPGIMEAANKGAKKAKGKSMGLNISLPMEQHPNPYQSKELAFEFHYFFIRKFWFFYPAKAIVVFPGGYGTLDEFFELLTLVQTNKSKKYMPIVLYGREYWEKVVDFDELVKWGTISKNDLNLFRMSDSVDDTFNYLKKQLSQHHLKKR